jgi:hypothetical protein
MTSRRVSTPLNLRNPWAKASREDTVGLNKPRTISFLSAFKPSAVRIARKSCIPQLKEGRLLFTMMMKQSDKCMPRPMETLPLGNKETEAITGAWTKQSMLLDMENNVFLTVQLCQSIMRDLNQDSQKQ